LKVGHKHFIRILINGFIDNAYVTDGAEAWMKAKEKVKRQNAKCKMQNAKCKMQKGAFLTPEGWSVGRARFKPESGAGAGSE
jgi:hypothetical protein